MLYKLIPKGNCEKVERITLADIGWREKDLENLISKNIGDLIYSNDLMTIFTERQGNEEPDIIALDSIGDLYIFELKRWASNKENLLQVLRYGQLFGGSNYDALNDLYKKHNLNGGELTDAHTKYFNLGDSGKLAAADFNQKQHFVIVTNGVDQETLEAISYWKNNGLNIDAIVYWVYKINNQPFIEFDMYSPVEGFISYENNSFVVNTSGKTEMIDEQKAAAYYPGWREKIQRLQKGDYVFLYHSGAGIVAYGIADGVLRKKDCDGHKDYEYYMHLNDFKKLKKPITANEMKVLAKKGFPFPQTMYTISDQVKNIFVREIEEKRL